VLAVGVDLHRVRKAGGVSLPEAGHHRLALAAVSRMAAQVHPLRLAFGDLVQHFAAGLAAAVIDDPAVQPKGLESLDGAGNGAFVTVKGDDDAGSVGRRAAVLRGVLALDH
jgi:hypothetical protein